MLLIIFSSIFAVSVYFVILRPNRHWDLKGVSCVKSVPIFGIMLHKILQRRSIPELIDDVYKAFPDKRYVGFFYFTSPVLMIRDLELIKKITVKEFDSFPDHRGFAASEVDPIESRGLINMEAADGWRDMRLALSPAFTSSKMRSMFVLMEQCVDQFTKYLEAQKGLVKLDIKDASSRFANDVYGAAVLGVTCDSLADKENKFYTMGKKLTTFTPLQNLKFLLYALSPTLMRIFRANLFSAQITNFYSNLVKETIKIREEKGIVRPDVVHLLMEARKDRLKYETQTGIIDAGFAVVEESELEKTKQKPKVQITDVDITAQVIFLLFAGFESVSTGMSYIYYELAKHPDVQQNLYREVEETCQDNITYEKILGMKYLDCVVSETLRKWPPTPFTDRVCKKPFTIEPGQLGERPVHIEAGSLVWVPICAIHSDPKYFPDPDKFDPDRFNDQNKPNIKPYSYIPFGVGPRNCLGYPFALLETKLLVVKLLQKFEVVPIDKTPERIVFTKKSFIPMPDGGIWLGFKPRST